VTPWGAVPPVGWRDLSFISLRTVAAVLLGELASNGADLVALVKPQFEGGPFRGVERQGGPSATRPCGSGCFAR